MTSATITRLLGLQVSSPSTDKDVAVTTKKRRRALTRPLLEAMESALNVSLAGASFDGGDHAGENRDHFQRALEWVHQEMERRDEAAKARGGK